MVAREGIEPLTRIFRRRSAGLNHIKWAAVEKAAKVNKPIRVMLTLANAKGNPVMASLRPDVAEWELPA
jgi:hypothetical protein